ncbi:hypothetical protein [Celeribacter baekdonensis]|uniref:Tetratricopeptide repeat-containing protein n=1 Tax=Celeribacter baekdonensis TaxID=875171 RepID=A0A2R4M6D1_9RHOB|nr:hypothetical protein [Celeribacter baekdonensis]AVW92706.1 hypothetical protein DA792_17740 [Celeribacter baekdonensis]
MIRVFTVILAIFICPLMLRAESVALLSGEHADFSRIVLQFPTVVDWEFGRQGDSYAFRVSEKDIEFDARAVFDKIPRTRITAISTEPSSFVIRVSDAVHADAFELREGRIVIDIKDGAPRSASKFERPFPAVETNQVMENDNLLPLTRAVETNETMQTPMPSLAEVNVAEPLLISGDGRDNFRGVQEDVIGQDIGQDGLEFPIVFGGGQAGGDRFASPPLSTMETYEKNTEKRNQRVDELQLQLLEQVGRAVSQGLLEADVTPTETIVEEAQSHAQTEEQQGQIKAPEAEVEDTKADRSHILIQSSIDREQLRPDDSTRRDENGNICLENTLVAIENWGDPLDQGLQLPMFRAGAIGEFDTPDPEGVKRLARYYLFLTFGVEAKSVLTNFGVTVEGHDILWAISDIMDHGYASNPGRLDQQFRCDGEVAFWSVMSKKHLNAWEEYNKNSILSTFSALPLHIRRHLGPILSERFLEINDETSAKNIQNAIARAEGEHGDAYDLLDAELQLADGGTEKAVSTFEDIVRQDGPMAAEALVRLIETKAISGEAIDRKFAENAEAMAVEYRGSADGEALQNAAILARIYSGDADVALRRVLDRETGSGADKTTLDVLMSAALEELASKSDEMTFSKVVIGNLNKISNAPITDSSRLNTSERLIDMGFFDAALEMMTRYNGEGDEEAKLILARAFLGTGEPDAALRYASQVPGEEARGIEAKAYFYLNEPEKALQSLEGLGEGTNKDTFAVIAEDWNGLEGSQNPDVARFAESVLATLPISASNTDGTPSLSSVQDILSSSREKRSALEAILD